MKTLVLVKKTIVLCALVLGACITGNAQQAFEVKHNGVPLQDGAVVEIKKSETEMGETTMKFEVAVKNISGEERKIRMIKEEVLLVPNTENDMCGWGQCVDTQELEGILSDGETEQPYATFKLNPGGGEPATGTSTIRYTFKSRSLGDPAITVTVEYNYENVEEPEEKPEEPGEKPEEPGDKPEEPGDKPEEPGDKPVEPPVVINKKFEIRHNNKLLEDGAVVEIRESEKENGETHMKFKVDVTNTSNATLSMRMIKDVWSVVANTENTMCWDVCVDPSEQVATCQSLPKGGISHPYADLTLNKNGSQPASGTSTIDYTFKTSAVTDPSITVTVKYIYEVPTGIKDVVLKDAFIVTQPAGEKRFKVSTTLEGNTPARLEIADFSGRIIQALSIQTGSGNVTATDVLPNGYYLLVLKRGNDVIGVRKGMIK